MALDFFLSLKEAMAEFSVSSDKFVFIPGNHDCNFDDPNTIRQVIIRDTIRGASDITKIDNEIVRKCLEVQNQYFRFISLFSKNPLTILSKLYTDHRFTVADKMVVFRSFNTAWMSDLEEKQGQLFFPMHLMDNAHSLDGDLVITLLHHPFRWFESDNARSFAKHVEATTDLILTGHEHVHARYEKVSFDGYTNQYIEGSVLQDVNSTVSGISAVIVDFSNSEQQTAAWHWTGSSYRLDRQPHWIPFSRVRRSSLFRNTAHFSKQLHDLGTAFTHPRKNELVFEDLFIYPDIAFLSTSNLKKGKLTPLEEIVSSRSLIDAPRPSVLILGSERSGKSTLAKALYLGFQGNGLKPLLLSGRDIKTGNNEETLKQLITSAALDQYGAEVVEAYHQVPLTDKVLIVDDLQDAKINESGQAALLKNLRSRFGNIIVFAHESFFLNKLTQSKPGADGFIAFSAFTLREMGNRLRGALIDKWMDLGQDNTIDERVLSLEIETLENQIRTLLGKNLLPSYPLFILIILQTYESQQALNTASGSYGYYYESLITTALHNRSRTLPHDTIYTFSSSVAYTMFTKNLSDLSRATFDTILEVYCKKHKIKPDNYQLRRVLKEARIFVWGETKRGRFQYKYIYYYFVAKYLAENIYRESASTEIHRLVSELMRTLHVEEHANIIIFFLYLTKDEQSIRTLLGRAKSLYDDSSPCNFDTDLDFTHKLITDRPAMMLKDGNTKRHKEEHRSQLDRMDDEADKHLAMEEDRQLEGAIKLNEALKTLQIMGQVLRNFPGSLEGEIKVAIAKESYLLGLRVLGFFCRFVGSNLVDLRDVFKELVGRKNPSDRKKVDHLADFVLYSIVSGVAFGMIKKISHSLGSEYLAETFEEVSDHRVPRSISLVNLSIKLDHFKEFPMTEIIKIYNEAHNHLFTSSIIQSMVLQHLYLFPVRQKVRQKVCDNLNIRIIDPKLIIGENRK